MKRVPLFATLCLLGASGAVQGQQSMRPKDVKTASSVCRLALSAQRIPEGKSVLNAVLVVHNPTRTVWTVSNTVTMDTDYATPADAANSGGPNPKWAAGKPLSILRPKVRYMVSGDSEMPMGLTSSPGKPLLTQIAAGGTAKVRLALPTSFLNAGPVRVQIVLAEGNRVAAETVPVRLDVFQAGASGRFPAPEAIAELFGLPKAAALTSERVRGAGANTEGTLLWMRSYANKSTTSYTITLAAYAKGTLLTTKRKAELTKIIARARKTPDAIADLHFFTFRTGSGQTGYNYGMAGLGGTGEFTTAPSRDGKSDLLVVVDYDVDNERSLPSPLKPTHKTHEIFDKLDTLLHEAAK